MKLWGGRFRKPLAEEASRLNASFSFDRRLYNEDIDGSLAWAHALARAGVLSEDELAAIEEGLESVRVEFATETFQALDSDEDIHTALERRLTELTGKAGAKLHTGRSRNDQVATDFRLWVMRACSSLVALLADLQGAVLESAQADLGTLMPGYTHLQPAQPVTWGHWLLSHFWALNRDRQRFQQVQRRSAVLPLGAGALAGTAYNIDRAAIAAELGFESVAPNSIDAVSDRDFALGFLYASAVLGTHLSRLAEQLILYSSPGFGFVSLSDEYSTGSSLMPQKKNPDVLELSRGKTGRLIGNLTALLTTLKGLPSAYDKDLQEDKEPVFDSFDNLSLLLPPLSGLIQSLTLNREKMAEAVSSEMLATDLADYLVNRGLPFRQAHEVAGEVVVQALEQDRPLDTWTVEDFKAVDTHFDDDVLAVFDAGQALARRGAVGGTSPEVLADGLAQARQALYG